MSRPRRFVPSPAMAVAMLALVAALGGQTAYGAAANFLLNVTNTSTAQTTLNGSAIAGKALQITNTNTTTGATALGLNVAAGHAPFTVTSNTKVAKLNADLLDGKDSTAFLPVAGQAADSNLLDGLDSTAFLPAAGKAADADKLDGLDSTAFLPVGGTAANSNLLDGLDSSQFARGNVTMAAAAWSVGAGTSLTEPNLSGLDITATCPANPLTQDLAITFKNTSGTVQNTFVESASSFIDYAALNNNNSIGPIVSPHIGQTYTVQMYGQPSLVSTSVVMHVALVGRSTDCHLQYEITRFQ
ncbi:MAG: hypothetical protein ACTHNU_18115 [Gaiellales bacterium]